MHSAAVQASCKPTGACKHMATSSCSRAHAAALHPSRPRAVQVRRCCTCLAAKDSRAETQETGAGLKAVWYGAETFGKLLALSKGKQVDTSTKPTTQVARAVHRGDSWPCTLWP